MVLNIDNLLQVEENVGGAVDFERRVRLNKSNRDITVMFTGEFDDPNFFGGYVQWGSFDVKDDEKGTVGLQVVVPEENHQQYITGELDVENPAPGLLIYNFGGDEGRKTVGRISTKALLRCYVMEDDKVKDWVLLDAPKTLLETILKQVATVKKLDKNFVLAGSVFSIHFGKDMKFNVTYEERVENPDLTMFGVNKVNASEQTSRMGGTPESNEGLLNYLEERYSDVYALYEKALLAYNAEMKLHTEVEEDGEEMETL